MALEEELMTESTGGTVEEEKKNFNDLTDEEVEAVKELEQSAWWEVLKKCLAKRVEAEEKSIISQLKDWFINPKPQGFTLYEVLWGFIQGMLTVERLVKVITQDPEEVKKAQEAMQKAEAIMRGEKVEWVDDVMNQDIWFGTN